MTAQPRHSVLFVCLGNICRSPLAEGVFRHVLENRGVAGRFLVDSAGTGGWHAGSPPDPRSVEIAARHGVDLTAQRARRIADEDFARFDLVLAMDRSNRAELKARAGAQNRDRVQLLMHVALGDERDVPDPYYGGAEGFETVYRMIRTASEALAEKLAVPWDGLDKGHASSTR
ncbi:low molecular weight phosphotyrosine protein phosphatase [Nitratireductor sp. CAU 1489]|uniref:protein-tyrosine-phosphatase n=1 Tax=Nitratireductor arenosus TaxID=2682096 RepID=A0A844Q8N6_9HYPH|nr:low molecular weight protein-tyrosine-phosphatase [Nitratireductor arenosus]MVA96456.1 low molecular weight phosphotyrosine protein phosphatase [Nitratireductor arenosus]